MAEKGELPQPGLLAVLFDATPRRSNVRMRAPRATPKRLTQTLASAPSLLAPADAPAPQPAIFSEAVLSGDASK